jgi:hypothetical protein
MHVVALAAVHLATLAVVAGLGLEMLLVAIVDQGVQPVDRLDPDVAALAAVTFGSACLERQGDFAHPCLTGLSPASPDPAQGFAAETLADRRLGHDQAIRGDAVGREVAPENHDAGFHARLKRLGGHFNAGRSFPNHGRR